MAIPIAAPYADGTLDGTLYTFANAGDTLPMHDHDAATAHITIITRGSFQVSGPGWSQSAAPGPVLSFDPGNPHQFVAMQADSRLLNILKG
jgi:quercetin dioxygenase-like cupin family protein